MRHSIVVIVVILGDLVGYRIVQSAQGPGEGGVGVGSLTIGGPQHRVPEQHELLVGGDAEVAQLAEGGRELPDQLVVGDADGDADEGEVEGARDVVQGAVDGVHAGGVDAVGGAEVGGDLVGDVLREERQRRAAIDEDGQSARGVVAPRPAAGRRERDAVQGDPVPRHAVGRAGRRDERQRPQRAAELARVDAAEDDHALLLRLAAERQAERPRLRHALLPQLVDEVPVLERHALPVPEPEDAGERVLRAAGDAELDALQVYVCKSHVLVVRIFPLSWQHQHAVVVVMAFAVGLTCTREADVVDHVLYLGAADAILESLGLVEFHGSGGRGGVVVPNRVAEPPIGCGVQVRAVRVHPELEGAGV